MKKEEKSYYEELHEQIGNTDYTNYEPVSPPSGKNGYAYTERRIIAIICALFLAILCFARFTQVCNYLGRDRELTLQNHHDYISIRASSQTVSNPQVYNLVVTAKKAIISAELTVKVSFSYYGEDLLSPTHTKEVFFSLPALEKGDTYAYTIDFEKITFCRSAQVLTISGRLP